MEALRAYWEFSPADVLWKLDFKSKVESQAAATLKKCYSVKLDCIYKFASAGGFLLASLRLCSPRVLDCLFIANK